MKDITVIGLGYVGLSIATLLSQKHHVIAYDIDKEKVDKLKKGISPIKDDRISDFLANKKLNLAATDSIDEAYSNRDYYVIATPTDYNEESQYFDTKSIEHVLKLINDKDKDASVVIKSTIPIFYTERIQKDFPELKLIFSPEFLREGQALQDNLYPSRIIVSPKIKEATVFGKMLKECSYDQDVEILTMSTTEAEAVKLFANSYLAMRVSYFNELDTFSETYDLDTYNIIKGISLDPRIGDYYNNPSFGYGGYCLPKDTKQLQANFRDIPSSIIHAVVDANDKRKEFVANQVISKGPKRVGVYKLAMKAGSDNFRSSSIRDVMEILRNNNIEVVIFDEQLMNLDQFESFKVISDFNEFLEISDVIITNRMSKELEHVNHKVYTRDVFGDN